MLPVKHCLVDPSQGLPTIQRREILLQWEKLFPPEVIEGILNYLSVQELRLFECVSSDAVDHTKRRWKRCLEEKQLSFYLEFTQAETCPEKMAYRFGKGLHAYVHARENMVTAQQRTLDFCPNILFQKRKKLYDRFEKLMICFPDTLGSYIWKDITSWIKVQSKYRQKFEAINLIEKTALTAGDFLLKGLSYLTIFSELSREINGDLEEFDEALHRITEENFHQAEKSLKTSFEKGAVVAGYLAIKILPCSIFENQTGFLEEFAFLSAEKGDYRGLEILLKENEERAFQWYSKKITYPPILQRIACISYEKIPETIHLSREKYEEIQQTVNFSAEFLEEKVKKHHIFIDWAMRAYGSDIPYHLFETTWKICCVNREYEKGEVYFNRATFLYPHYVSKGLYEAAFLKGQLDKFQEAENLLERLKAFGKFYNEHSWSHQIDRKLFEAFVKYKLGKWREAKKAIDDQIKNSSHIVPNKHVEFSNWINGKVNGKGDEGRFEMKDFF